MYLSVVSVSRISITAAVGETLCSVSFQCPPFARALFLLHYSFTKAHLTMSLSTPGPTDPSAAGTDENVSLKSNSSERPESLALRNFSFRFEAGKIYSTVG